MREISLNSQFVVYSPDELTDFDSLLVSKAREATETSYSPYSQFQVGAAVMLRSGGIVTGSNQENAAYGICQCAERNALFSAACHFPDDAPVAIAIAAQTGGSFLSNPIPPGGACRQAMQEVENRYGTPLHIILYGTESVWVCEGIKHLLPLSFVADTMNNQ